MSFMLGDEFFTAILGVVILSDLFFIVILGVVMLSVSILIVVAPNGIQYALAYQGQISKTPCPGATIFKRPFL